MANKIGPLIKEARTGAGLTREQLAKKVDGVTAADISKAERGEKELTQSALRQIAKATGVTQSSLIEAAKASTYKTSSASGAKKTASKKTSAELKLTAGEKKLVELYREADSDTRKKAVSVLKGEQTGVAGLIGGILGELDGVDLGGIADMLGKK